MKYKWLWILLALGFLAMIGWGVLTTWSPRPMDHLYKGKKRPLAFGHRGGRALAPENTMLAFRRSHHDGAAGVEFDVMLSKDGQVIVFHDYTLQKRLGGKGKIKDMTLAQLRKLNLKPLLPAGLSPLPPTFLKARIPTLREVLQFYKDKPTLLNIEVKGESLGGDGLEEKVLALIREFGLEKRVLVSSFNPFQVWRFRRLAPHIPTGLIYAPDNPIYIRNLWFFSLARPGALHPKYTLVDEAYMRWARQHGFRVHVWTVNKEEDMRRMIRLGVDIIVTDNLPLLQQVLRSTRQKTEKKKREREKKTTKNRSGHEKEEGGATRPKKKRE